MQTLSYEPDTLYFNVRMTNNNNNNPFSVPANYDSTSQNTPLIGDPSKYYVTITDFSCPGESIPIAIARIVPNQGNAKLMTSKIKISYDGLSGEEDLEFIPSTNEDPPIQNKQYQVITPYYYIYSYDQIIQSINVAIAKLVVTCNIPVTEPLYFAISYEKDLPKIKLVIGKGLLTTATDLKISINNDLVNYLGGFSYAYNYKKSDDALDFIFDFPLVDSVLPADFENNTFYLPKSAYKNDAMRATDQIDNDITAFVFEQQNYLLPQWNCLSKIIIYTQSIPVRNQQTTSRVLESPDIVNKYPILFSFTPNYETSSQARNYIYYAPKESYLLTEMLSNSPLYKIQLSVGWVDHNGEIFPLYLNPFQSCTVQLAFMKKDLYKSVK